MTKIEKAIEFAFKAHEGQVRKDSGIPYITHPLCVARLHSLLFSSIEKLLLACVLHDVVEDTKYEISDIMKLFGAGVASIVDELTSPKKIKNKEIYWKIFVTGVSNDALNIKFCDRFCNIQDFASCNPEYARKYALQGKAIFEEFFRRNPDTNTFFINQLEDQIGLLRGRLYEGKI